MQVHNNPKEAVWAVRISCGVGAVVFAALAVKTMSHYTGEVSGVVLAWMWFLFAAVCAIAAVQSFQGRYTPSLVWCLTALTFNAAICLYVVWYDRFRTPVHQMDLERLLAAFVVFEAVCAGWTFRRWHAQPDRTKVEVKALLSLIPILTLFGAWYSHVYQPHNSLPIVTATAQLTAGTPYNGRTTVTGSIALKNIGSVDAGIVGSLYKVTARGLDSSQVPSSLGAAGNEQRIETVLTNQHVLEPFGDNQDQLATPLPTAELGTTLVALDEVTPGYFFLAPQETYERRFAFDVPVDASAPNPVTLDLSVTLFVVNGVLDDFQTCDNDQADKTYASLVMRENTNGGGGYFSCVEARLPARTPVGALVGDHPGVRAYVLIGQPSRPATASGQLLGVFSVDGHALSDNLASEVAQAQVLEKFAPTVFAETQDQIELPAGG